MEDIFKTRAHKEFVELSEVFIDQMLTLWPDDDDAKDMKVYFTGVVKGSDSQEKEMIQAWYTNITTPLNKKVKYGKALERILGQPPIVFHACEYNDIDGLQISSNSRTLERLNVFEKYKDGTMQDEDKKIFWKFISQLNRACAEYMDFKLPLTPSRDEIHKNIKSKKTIASDEFEQPSMVKAFQTSLEQLCSHLHQENITNNMKDEEIRNLMTRWAAYAQDSFNGVKMTVLCNNKDPNALTALMTHFSELKLQDAELTNDVWNTICQLNGYSAVGDNIPTKMMGKIENLANKLAGDIMNGRTDLSEMNLAEIGQQVLSQCDEEEMSKFANNIENLLPALQTFQGTNNSN